LPEDVKQARGCNLNRARGVKDNRYSSWSNTRRDFRSVQYFGILKMDNDFSPYLLRVRALTEPADTGEELAAIFEVADASAKGDSLIDRLGLLPVDGKAFQVEQPITLKAGAPGV